ncbi:MAG: SpoVR family protein [Calditrichaeota bacterium]|nr:MAG: SpoVR family protein [Calditrichota bacterium]
MRSATTEDIRALQPEIEQYAREYGLDFFPIVFELVDYDTMNQLAAYGGFPVRYPHWRFGMEYDQLSKGYRYGLQKIYEMVINTNPCYAYLMKSNPLVDQKLVMAHVYAHCDFFKNNYYFSHTNRKMIDEMANHAIRVRRYIDRHGLETVEDFIDICLSLENLIDVYSPYIRRSDGERSPNGAQKPEGIKKLKSPKKYLEKYINPPEFIEEQKKKLEQEKIDPLSFPSEPQRDVLLFLMEHAPLENWQYDVLGIIREEAYYFAPQAMTKIMNEGWATYWHSKMMTEKILTPDELIDYAEHHSGTVANHPGRLNPYRIGVLLFKDIEDRWNKGKFGKEYEECDDLREKAAWDKQLGLGREKIFQVRQLYNDVTFIDTFLTPEFCKEHKLFSWAYNKNNRRYEIESREFHMIKKRLLQSLTNAGQPIIQVIDANYKNRGELMLQHVYEGVELDKTYAADTLRNLQLIWKRPVHIETRLDEKPVILSFDGKEFSQKWISES